MNARTYMLQTALATLALALSVLAFTWAVDPYAITGAPRLPYFNEFKVDINNHARLMKKYHPERGEFDALVLGNSRVEMGIDPRHECFQSAGMSVYNLGLPGAPLRMQFEYALNAVHQQPVRRIYLSLDFSDFIHDRPVAEVRTPLRNVSEGELRFLPDGSANPAYAGARFMDYYRSMFSLDALAGAVRTVAGQGSDAPDRDTRGFNPARDFAAMVRVEGPRALFDQKMDGLRSVYANSLYLRNAPDEPGIDFRDLEDFLDILLDRNIQVVLFTNPFHQQYWDMLEEYEKSGLFASWMSRVRDIAARRANRGVAFWDFSSDSPFIHEPVPGPGELTGPLRWFWEPAHYRRELGDLMVETMLAESCGTGHVFGNRLQ